MTAGPHAALFVGTSEASSKPTLVSVDLAAGATVDLPGPAAGFVRAYYQVGVYSTTVAVAIGVVTVAIWDGVTSWPVTPGPTAASLGSSFAPDVPIGVGEVYRLVNAGANANRIAAAYVDYPAANVGLVRANITNVAQVLIPAPPAGFYRRCFHRTPGQDFQYFATPGAAKFYNRDTVAHQAWFRLGGVLLQRILSVASNAAVNPSIPLLLAPYTADLTLELFAAPTTTPPIFLGAYEQLPLA
jgi:hypothetical protein